MPEFRGLPLHPAFAHFPIAGTVFAALALLYASFAGPSRRAEPVRAAFLLLVVSFLSGLGAAFDGQLWADALGLVAGGAWLPEPGAKGGLLLRHAYLSLAATTVLLPALLLARRARDGSRSPVPALAASLVAASLLLVSGHVGGQMVHAPERGAAAPR